MSRPLRIRVPATTANLGPGLDALGAALDLWNEVAWTPGAPGSGLIVRAGGEGAAELARPGVPNLVLGAWRWLFEREGRPLPDGELRLTNRIPFARGLGSSAAAVVGGLALGRALLGQPIDAPEVFAWAAEIEGHADNVGAALYGGVRAAFPAEGGALRSVHLRLRRRLHGAVVWPEARVSTAEARAALPPSVPLESAVASLQRTAAVVAALASGDEEALRAAMRDGLHEPARTRLAPGLAEVLACAREEMRLAAALSGSGPAVLLLSFEPVPQAAVERLVRLWEGLGVRAHGRRVRVGGRGAHLAAPRARRG
ncbi:MAG: homoserine kinase [Firmicutes bacterium]|nr:homoserine kinase [Bacillota bacterium]